VCVRCLAAPLNYNPRFFHPPQPQARVRMRARGGYLTLRTENTMANKQIVFADRVVGLSLQNGLVRIDLATIAGPAKTKDGKDGLKMDITHQLVLPVDSFVNGVAMQQQMVKELVTRQQKRVAKAKEAKADDKPAADAKA